MAEQQWRRLGVGVHRLEDEAGRIVGKVESKWDGTWCAITEAGMGKPTGFLGHYVTEADAKAAVIRALDVLGHDAISRESASPALHAAIVSALSMYHCQHTKVDEDTGRPLADMLTPQGDSSIARGLEELELLADDIFNEAEPVLLRALGVQEVGFAQPVAWRVRGYNQFKTGAPRPWRYFDGSERPKVNDPDGCDIEPVYGCPSVRACGLPSNYVNAARILASDMPATVVQKLDAAARAAGVALPDGGQRDA